MVNSEQEGVKSPRWKYIIGGALFVIAVILLVISATRATAEFFMTIEELQGSQANLAGENLRVSGAVLGDSIAYDTETGLLHFTIAHIPAEEDEIEALGGLGAVLHQAANDSDVPLLDVVYQGAQPDMLRHEAQAIVTGSLNADGVFMAEELLLKCPTKYEEALPEQAE